MTARKNGQTEGEAMTPEEIHADPIRALCQLLKDSGAIITIGLRQQGKFETVMEMRSQHKDWDEIGAVIGWSGTAVQRWFEIEVIDELRKTRALLAAKGTPRKGKGKR